MAETSSPRAPPHPPPPPEEQPDSKRQKMSTTTSDEENAAAIPRTPRYKRRKIAIFFAYCGVGYQGMQKNPGAKTIEGDFEEALYFAGAVPEADRGMPRRFDWARSARTDKGVSAVGQVVSGKFYVDPPGFIERLNSHLSPQIRVFGYTRTTAAFNAKKFCDRRRYVYMIPVFALNPSSHRDRESVLASLGSDDELIKCVECSERGRKIPGIMGKRSFESNHSVEIGSGILSDNGVASVENKIVIDNETGIIDSEQNSSIKNGNIKELEHVKEVLVEDKIVENTSQKGNDYDDASSETNNLWKSGDGKVETMKDDSVEFGSGVLSNNGNDLVVENKIAMDCCADNETGKHNSNVEAPHIEELEHVKDVLVEDKIVENCSGKGHDDHASNEECRKMEKKSDFCYGEAEKERFNRILKCYEGTRNFHNFTTRTKAEDPAAKRYILSFNAKTVVNIDGIDFIKCEVVGQSFMLHQIRKMIGLAVAIMRNCCPESIMDKVFEPKVNINIPTAPEVGLFLDECFFSSYNQKWGDTHDEVSLIPYADEAEKFKVKYIYPHIAASEHRDGAVAVWLHCLNHRNYPDFGLTPMEMEKINVDN